MYKMLRKHKAQSTVEVAVLLIVVIGALLAIQGYLKKGVQGGIQKSADDIGKQFSPGNTNAYITTTTTGSTREINTKGSVTTNILAPETTTVEGNMTIINVDQEFWGAP